MAHTVILTSDGKVHTIGRGLEGQLGVNSKQLSVPSHVERITEPVSQIAAGMTFSLALGATSKQVYVFGSGLKGLVRIIVVIV